MDNENRKEQKVRNDLYRGGGDTIQILLLMYEYARFTIPHLDEDQSEVMDSCNSLHKLIAELGDTHMGSSDWRKYMDEMGDIWDGDHEVGINHRHGSVGEDGYQFLCDVDFSTSKKLINGGEYYDEQN